MRKVFLFLMLWAAPALAQTTVFPNTIVFPNTTVLAVPPGATWTVVQHVKNTCTTTGTGSTQILSCAVTVTSTTAGNLLILGAAAFTSQQNIAATFSSASGDTFTHCPANLVNAASGGNTNTADCAYRLSATGGATSLTWAWTANVPAANAYDSTVEALEIKRSSGTATFDGCSSGSTCFSSSTSCTSCAVATPSITGTSDYVLQWGSFSGGAPSAISGAGYNQPFDTDSTTKAGFAGALNQSSVIAQNWTQTSGRAAMSAVSFK